MNYTEGLSSSGNPKLHDCSFHLGWAGWSKSPDQSLYKWDPKRQSSSPSFYASCLIGRSQYVRSVGLHLLLSTPSHFLNIYKGLLLSCYCSPGYFNSEIHLVSSLFVAWAFLIFLLTMSQRISKGFGSGVGVVWPVKHSKTIVFTLWAWD